MKRKLAVFAGALLCAGMVVAAAINTTRTVDRGLVTSTTFTLYPTDSTTSTVAARVATQYLEPTALDTFTAIEIGPWRQVVTLLRIDASSTDSTDDSVDTKVYYDKSWDGTNWTVHDSVTITDTVAITKQLDSAATVQGSWLRVRVDPVAGMRVDSLGIRPYITVRVIAK